MLLVSYPWNYYLIQDHIYSYKEESEKVGLKLNIQKTKIMASGPITSWEVDGEEFPFDLVQLWITSAVFITVMEKSVKLQ